MRRTQKSNASGFTLLELLIAMAITLVLAGLMLAVVTGTLDLWRHMQDNFTTSAQATLALDMVERDLQSAIFRKDNLTWLAVDVVNTPSSLAFHGWLTSALTKPATSESRRIFSDLGDGSVPLISNARFGLSGTWLRFVTTNVEAGGSLPVAVAYQIARRPVSGSILITNPAEMRYSLFRSAVSSAGTFAAGNDVTASGYGSTSVTPADSRTAKTLTNPNSTDALATNVVDFGIWLYVREEVSGNLRRLFPADNGDFTHAAHDTGAAPDANRFPEVADVMIRIISSEGATLLSEIETGGGHIARPSQYVTDAEWWWGVVEGHSRVFVRRIAVAGVSQ